MVHPYVGRWKVRKGESQAKNARPFEGSTRGAAWHTPCEVELSSQELDALKELANIGSGHAATALSRLLGGKRVAIDPPRAELGLSKSLFVHAPPQGVVASLELQGMPVGALLFTLSVEDARELSAQLLGRGTSEEALSPEAHDALQETANIVASAYLSALAAMTGTQLIPSVPSLTHGGVEAAANDMALRLGGPPAVVLNVRFAAGTTAGELWLLLASSITTQLLSGLHTPRR
jgi:chemotaxis protein CheC